MSTTDPDQVVCACVQPGCRNSRDMRSISNTSPKKPNTIARLINPYLNYFGDNSYFFNSDELRCRILKLILGDPAPSRLTQWQHRRQAVSDKAADCAGSEGDCVVFIQLTYFFDLYKIWNLMDWYWTNITIKFYFNSLYAAMIYRSTARLGAPV